MLERDRDCENHFRLVESPGRDIHGLIVNRDHGRGFKINGFARIDVTSIEPECLLVQVTPFSQNEKPAPEQILKWYMPYNFEGTDFYLVAALNLHPANLYARAKIIMDIPRDVSVLWDEFYDKDV